MKCHTVKASTCTGRATKGLKRCPGCRAMARLYKARHDAKHPGRAAEINRKHQALYYSTKNTPKAIAYRERHRESRLRSCRSWNARNYARKLLISRFANAVAAGEIVKPVVCQDCRKRKNPIVAWGLREGDDGFEVSRWCCWGCWWKRKRAAKELAAPGK